jgi:hypothetical protein
MLVMQAHDKSVLAYPFRPHEKTAADHTPKRSLTTKPISIQPPPMPAKIGVARIGSIFADR